MLPITAEALAVGKSDIEAKLREFHQLKSHGQLTPDIADQLATSAVAAFMMQYQATGEYWRDAIMLLCEIATLPNENLARAGLRGLFPLIVERLADSFEPTDCSLYYRVFAQVVQFCRPIPAGHALDAQLSRFSMQTEEDVLKRIERIRKVRTFDRSQVEQVKKVFVLSRITLGADIEITSVVLQKMKRLFSKADIILLAEEKVGELFGGDHRVRLHSLRYHRGGGLIDRLSSWLSVVEALDKEMRSLSSEEYLVIDPDSRLTQLGLLPVTQDESSYYFFESRGYRHAGARALAQLTGQWLHEVFEVAQVDNLRYEEVYPYVSLRREALWLAEALIQKLRRGGVTYVVSLSFGVGGNLAKRIPDPFEENLLLSLIDDRAVVFLDKGSGEDELRRIDELIRKLRERGKKLIEIDQHNISEILKAEKIQTDAITWHGGIGQFSAFIRESDQYIGYDSAGQHIAAALEVPTLVIFAGYTSPLIPERWRPHTRGLVRTVLVDTLSAIRDPRSAICNPRDPETVLSEAIQHYHQTKSTRRRR